MNTSHRTLLDRLNFILFIHRHTSSYCSKLFDLCVCNIVFDIDLYVQENNSVN